MRFVLEIDFETDGELPSIDQSDKAVQAAAKIIDTSSRITSSVINWRIKERFTSSERIVWHSDGTGIRP